MRTALLILASLAVTSTAGAGTLRLPPTEQAQSGRTLPLKGSAGSAKGTARVNGCASYGQGFTMVEGTCVKIGGAVRVDAVTGR
jgi:hypothetical protein